MEKVIGGQKTSCSSKYFYDLLGMLENYLHSIAKLGGGILNQRKLMHEKKVRLNYVKWKLHNKFLAIKTKNMYKDKLKQNEKKQNNIEIYIYINVYNINGILKCYR